MSPVAAFAVASATASSPCTGALPSGPALPKDSVATAEDARSVGAPLPGGGASAGGASGLSLSAPSLTGARREEALALLRAVAAFRTAPHAAPCGAAHLLQPRNKPTHIRPFHVLTAKKDSGKEMGKTTQTCTRRADPTREEVCASESRSQTQTQHYHNTAQRAKRTSCVDN